MLDVAEGDAEWTLVGQMPVAGAYGSTVPIKDGLVCIGGQNSQEAHANVRLMRWDQAIQQVTFTDWPSLPLPMANMGAALMDQYIYVVGGKADGKVANSVLRLDLKQQGTAGFQWEQSVLRHL